MTERKLGQAPPKYRGLWLNQGETRAWLRPYDGSAYGDLREAFRELHSATRRDMFPRPEPGAVLDLYEVTGDDGTEPLSGEPKHRLLVFGPGDIEPAF
jgi:hypothetical protein